MPFVCCLAAGNNDIFRLENPFLIHINNLPQKISLWKGESKDVQMSTQACLSWAVSSCGVHLLHFWYRSHVLKMVVYCGRGWVDFLQYLWWIPMQCGFSRTPHQRFAVFSEIGLKRCGLPTRNVWTKTGISLSLLRLEHLLILQLCDVFGCSDCIVVFVIFTRQDMSQMLVRFLSCSGRDNSYFWTCKPYT